MKIYFTLLFSALLSLSFAQEIKLSEENQSFNLGSRNSLVVNIPYGTKDLVEKELKKELKDWSGKYDSKGEEYFTLQAITKFMGVKPFDAYAKMIVVQGGDLKIAFAIDLGGAYMNSREHNEQFKAMSERIKAFAKETAAKCVEQELEKNKDVLSDLEKDQRSLEKDKKNLEEDIESYKKKIADAEEKIKTNIKNQETQKESIKNQQTKVADTEKRLNLVK